MIRDACALLAISKTTAEHLVRFFPESSDRVSVARLGADHLPRPNDKKSSSCDRNGCLFVGARREYKNFLTLIEAVASDSWPAYLKVYVVGPKFSENEIRLLRYFNVEHVFEDVGIVSDSELSRLYRRSQCFVFPSLGEGFGLPTIEAQLNGCLPVLSDLPVFREVGGEGAIYFEPGAPQELANAVSEALKADVQERMISHCAQNVDRFSWDDTAQAILDCYRQVWKQPLQTSVGQASSL